MIYSSLSDFGAALLADADLLVAVHLVTNTDALTALIDEVSRQAEDGTVTRAQVQALEEAAENLRNARYNATAIESVPEQMAQSKEMFDLNGRKVQAPQKGIYVVNRRKYLKK